MVLLLPFFRTTAFGQSSSATNNSTGALQFLGFNGTGGGGPKILDIHNDYNLPIRFWTNGFQRTKLNGTFLLGSQYAVNNWGFGANFAGINTSGYLLLGPDKPLGFGGTLYNKKGAFSLLHLNGERYAYVQGLIASNEYK